RERPCRPVPRSTAAPPSLATLVRARTFAYDSSPRASAPASNGRLPRVSWVGIVLTLRMRRKEGHQAYRAQSEPPRGRGTTLGGQTDDPGRQRTRTATASNTSGGGPGQCQRGLPGTGDLAHPVLPLAEALRAVRGRRGASAAAAGPPRAANPGG